MCGYAGLIWKNGVTPSHASDILERIGPLLHHRGPDEGGTHIGNGFAVVHRRLSIIDAAHGHQPMLADNGRVGLAYNGEIYNYREVRAGLEQKGYQFKTNGDTEVLLALFMLEGAECFEHLDGMFTAFIWDYRDSPDGYFYLVRDHLGIKPLYLYEDGHKIVFSSELLPLMAAGEINLAPDPIGLASYLTYRYTQSPYTLFKYIRRMEAGTYVKVHRGRSSEWRYWDLPMNENGLAIDEYDAASELKRLLRESVAQQQMSDVPIGLLLSGGLDSSAIASICSDLGVSMTSFSIGFPNLNEFKYSRDVAQKFDLPHIAVETSPNEIINRFGCVVAAMDEPIADPACFPLHILCDEIKKHVTVVLSGEGSDEMLGGYPQYGHVLYASTESQQEKFSQFLNFSWYFNRPVPLKEKVPISRLYRQRIYFEERSSLNGMLAYDLKTWLPENLMAKADKILMSHSLEGRFPFLSRRLIEFTSALPEEFKIGKNGGKSVLRLAFNNDLPSSVLTRPKMGFSVPVGDLVLNMRDRMYDLLESSRHGIFSDMLDHDALMEDFNDHYSGVRDQPLWLWTVLVLLQWQEITNVH